MRKSALVSVCLLFLLTTQSFAAIDPLTTLRDLSFTSVEDVCISLPHGRARAKDVIVASPSPSEAVTRAVVLGEVELTFDALPNGSGALNLFAEMDAAQAGTVDAPLKLLAEGLYLDAAESGGTRIEFGAGSSASRQWDQLTPEEQAGFEEIYLQAYGDSWVREDAEEFELRETVGGEVYSAFWVEDIPGVPHAPGQTRFDYRVLADGRTVTVEDYARGITFLQAPWAPEEGELDSNISVTRAEYSYTLSPGMDTRDRVQVTARVNFNLMGPATTLKFLSAPWFGMPEVRFEAGRADAGAVQLLAFRGDPGVSQWVLSVTGSFERGSHSLTLAFPEIDIPEDFRGPGSGGVYRFDSSPLLPHEQSKEVVINVAAPDRTLKSFASVQLEPGRPVVHTDGSARQLWTLTSPNSNRNEMVVLTGFPSREVPTTWGTLNITAPREMLEDTGQLAGVQSLEAMVDYFLRAWGDPRTGLPVPTGVPAAPYTLNVFFIPEESGVQAFEDAGMVFILGGQQSYGGQGGGQLPLIAHEVAHVWWGHGVAAPRWFTEGMANYAAAKFVEHYYGAGGPASGQGDPLSYRRYLINFGLGTSIPISLERRDQLDDSAAIYHESAGFLLTADNRLAGGLDPMLARLYAGHVNQAVLSHGQLGREMVEQAPALESLWATMVEQGLIEAGADDPTYRELVRTPDRDKYAAMLGWLNPAYRKNARGDFAGAYYAISRSLEFRREPKDLLMAAELALKAGRLDHARRHVESLAGADLDQGQQARLQAVEAGMK